MTFDRKTVVLKKENEASVNTLGAADYEWSLAHVSLLRQFWMLDVEKISVPCDFVRKHDAICLNSCDDVRAQDARRQDIDHSFLEVSERYHCKLTI